jgi:hypothetical protein
MIEDRSRTTGKEAQLPGCSMEGKAFCSCGHTFLLPSMQEKWDATPDSEKPAAIAIIIASVVAQIGETFTPSNF